jgi:putative IMPACT (imprinted ancient) family translation regulator
MSLFSDVYYEVERDAEFVLRERGSKFFAYVYAVRGEKDIKEKLDGLKRMYPDATHHCYAWVMGARGEAQRANDDGEPGNSAGRPILRVVISAGLTNVLVVVVRYFGGTLNRYTGDKYNKKRYSCDKRAWRLPQQGYVRACACVYVCVCISERECVYVCISERECV